MRAEKVLKREQASEAQLRHAVGRTGYRVTRVHAKDGNDARVGRALQRFTVPAE